MAVRGRTGTEDRLRVVGVALIALGVAVHGFLSYRVLQAGGFTSTSLLGACAQAATGRFDPTYRLSEQVGVDRDFFPPGAVCRWSGGTSATLAEPRWWGWTGVVLVVLGVVALVAVRVVTRRRRA